MMADCDAVKREVGGFFGILQMTYRNLSVLCLPPKVSKHKTHFWIVKVSGDSITSSDWFEIGPTNYSQADSLAQPRKHPL